MIVAKEPGRRSMLCLVRNLVSRALASGKLLVMWEPPCRVGPPLQSTDQPSRLTTLEHTSCRLTKCQDSRFGRVFAVLHLTTGRTANRPPQGSYPDERRVVRPESTRGGFQHHGVRSVAQSWPNTLKLSPRRHTRGRRLATQGAA